MRDKQSINGGECMVKRKIDKKMGAICNEED